VRDINDNSPRFDTVASGHTVLSILESVAVGSTFLLPSATDPDSPSFGVHRYDIASDSNTLNFNSTRLYVPLAQMLKFRRFSLSLGLKNLISVLLSTSKVRKFWFRLSSLSTHTCLTALCPGLPG